MGVNALRPYISHISQAHTCCMQDKRHSVSSSSSPLATFIMAFLYITVYCIPLPPSKEGKGRAEQTQAHFLLLCSLFISMRFCFVRIDPLPRSYSAGESRDSWKQFNSRIHEISCCGCMTSYSIYSTYDKMIFRPALNFEEGMSLKGPPSSFSPLKLSIINTKLDEKGKARKLFGQTGNGANLSSGEKRRSSRKLSRPHSELRQFRRLILAFCFLLPAPCPVHKTVFRRILRENDVFWSVSAKNVSIGLARINL